jgi:hypothetical protein
LAFLIGAVLLAGCGLNFGQDYTLDSASFDARGLATVAQATRLQLPEGVRGLHLVYHGADIDDALVAKLEVPREAVTNLLAQIAAVPGTKASASETLAAGHSWWTEAALKVAAHRKLNLGSEYLELILGEEGSQWVLLVKWFST